MQDAKAAAISSATHPSPPSKSCILFIIKGFVMSKNLKNANPNNTPHALYSEWKRGRKQNGIAQNSSSTMHPGSRIFKKRSAVSHIPTHIYANIAAKTMYLPSPIPANSAAYSTIPAALPHVPGAFSEPSPQRVANLVESFLGRAAAHGYSFFLAESIFLKSLRGLLFQ